MGKIDFSFCIVNWNGGEQFIRCLQSIETEITANPKVECEIVVVDNDSSDIDQEMITSHTHLRFHRNATNVLFASATNQSVEYARGTYLVILNNDVQLKPGFLQEALKQLRQHSQVDLIVPRLLNVDGTIQKNIVGLPKPKDLVYYAFCLHLISSEYAHWMNPNFIFSQTETIGTNLQPAFSALIMTRKCWLSVGPLDEQFPLLWNDVDWFYRFHTAKKKALYIPTITASHYHGLSVNRHRFKKIITSTRSMRVYMQKHYPMIGLKSVEYDLIYLQLMLLRFGRELLLMLLRQDT